MAKNPIFSMRLNPADRDHLRSVAEQQKTTTTALILDALRKAGHLPASGADDDASAAA